MSNFSMTILCTKKSHLFPDNPTSRVTIAQNRRFSFVTGRNLPPKPLA
jgi:hypothetical protein